MNDGLMIDKYKLELALARNHMNKKELAEKYGVSPQRLYIITNSSRVTPRTAGRLADALGVDVTEIIK